VLIYRIQKAEKYLTKLASSFIAFVEINISLNLKVGEK